VLVTHIFGLMMMGRTRKKDRKIRRATFGARYVKGKKKSFVWDLVGFCMRVAIMCIMIFGVIFIVFLLLIVYFCHLGWNETGVCSLVTACPLKN